LIELIYSHDIIKNMVYGLLPRRSTSFPDNYSGYSSNGSNVCALGYYVFASTGWLDTSTHGDFTSFPVTGVEGTKYIASDTGLSYYWGGDSAYHEIYNPACSYAGTNAGRYCQGTISRLSDNIIQINFNTVNDSGSDWEIKEIVFLDTTNVNTTTLAQHYFRCKFNYAKTIRDGETFVATFTFTVKGSNA